MNKLNEQIEVQDTSFNSSALGKTTKSYIFYTILAGILTIIPVGFLILELINLVNPSMNISEDVYTNSFYIIKVIGFLIYLFVLKKAKRPKYILIIIAGVFLLLSGFMYNNMNNMEHTGIDYIGQALGMGIIFNVCLYMYYALAFVLFIIYAKNFIFKKKVIISIILSIATIILVVFGYNIISHYTSIQNITQDIPTINDFKNELKSRNLYTTDNLLFGVDNKAGNIHKISFNDNGQYPSYIYYGYKTKNVSKNINKYDEYLNWIIYYTNGKLYAVVGELDDSQLFQDFYRLRMIYRSNSNILSEDEEIYTYNWEENYYENIDVENDSVVIEDLRYYNEDGTYIFVDVFEKFSSTILQRYEIIGKIDSNTLDIYANSLK